MATKKSMEGVGKKIVEALKKQSETSIEEPMQVLSEKEFDDFSVSNDSTDLDMHEDSFEEVFEQSEQIQEQNDFQQENEELTPQADISVLNNAFPPEGTEKTQYFEQPQQSFNADLNVSTENVKILGNLINQLPAGISKQMGAQIIKQTMEALGISMKTVLSEAQQIQENLSMSSRECLNSIQEYKNQIQTLEKQVQTYHKQYNALNELISLFVQTGI